MSPVAITTYQSLDGDVGRGSSPGDRFDIIDRHESRDGGEMKTCGRRNRLEMLREISGDRCGDQLMSLAVDAAEAPEVPGEIAVLDESSEYVLR